MLIRDVLLDKRGSFEKLLARFASESPFVFLLDVLLNRFTQLSATRIVIPGNLRPKETLTRRNFCHRIHAGLGRSG